MRLKKLSHMRYQHEDLNVITTFLRGMYDVLMVVMRDVGCRMSDVFVVTGMGRGTNEGLADCFCYRFWDESCKED